MKKTYYQQDLVSTLTNRKLKNTFKQIGLELFNLETYNTYIM